MIVSACLLVGCGSAPDVAATEAPPADEPGTTRVQIGAVEGRLPGAWTMEAEQSSVALQGEDDTSAIGLRVSGQLLKGDKIESRFVAASGEANTQTGRLELSGEVRVTSERDGVYLTADRLVYDKELALIIAEGRVEVHSATWVSGPFDKLVATPGLERVGTPDRFGL